MEKNNFERVCNSISFKTYNNLVKGSFISSIAFGGARELVDSSLILDGTLLGVALTSLGLFMVLSGSGYISKTKDINELKELYNEFLDNYVKLNNTFGFTNPVQISELYSFLLYNGYLSMDKEFTFTSKGVFDKINSIDGTNIAIGKGVCRHISALLTDILNKCGIDASRLCVYAADPEIIVRVLKENKYTLEELYNIARKKSLDEETYNLFCRLIKEYVIDKGHDIEFDFKLSDDKNLIKQKIGNHTITFVADNGIGYYLDPTRGSYYISDGTIDKVYDSYSFPIDIKVAPSIVFSGVDGFNRLKKEAGKMPSLSGEEIKRLSSEADKICKENHDLFEKFYSENQELYGEISAKVLQLKR